MRRALLPAIALMLVTALPASAQTPTPTPPCAASEQYASLGLAGKNEAFAPEPIPSFPYDIVNLVQPTTYREESVTRFRYRVDVSGSTTKPYATNATVELNLTWDNDTDFDLFVYDSTDTLIDSSNTFNPLDGSGEALTFAGVAHCTDIRIDVVNYLGRPDSALVLDAKVKNLKP
jgi:hypothetical protein